VARSKIQELKNIPGNYLRNIEDVEFTNIAVNALCLFAISVSCIQNIHSIQQFHYANPDESLLAVSVSTSLFDAIWSFFFPILPLYVFFWKQRLDQFSIQLRTADPAIAAPLKKYTYSIFRDGNPIRTLIYATTFNVFSEVFCFFILPQDVFLSHIVTLQSAIAIIIYIVGILSIHRHQRKHLYELDENLVPDDTLQT